MNLTYIAFPTLPHGLVDNLPAVQKKKIPSCKKKKHLRSLKDEVDDLSKWQRHSVNPPTLLETRLYCGRAASTTQQRKRKHANQPPTRQPWRSRGHSCGPPPYYRCEMGLNGEKWHPVRRIEPCPTAVVRQFDLQRGSPCPHSGATKRYSQNMWAGEGRLITGPMWLDSLLSPFRTVLIALNLQRRGEIWTLTDAGITKEKKRLALIKRTRSCFGQELPQV